MSRLKIGPSHQGVNRVIKAPTAPASTSPTPNQTIAAPVKADLATRILKVDSGADPMPVTLVVPPYNPALFNTLIGLTVIASPFGSGKPSDAAGWITSAHPKATVGSDPTLALAPAVAPATAAAAAVAPAAAAAVAPATVPAPPVAPAVVTPAAVAPAPTAPVTAPPVAPAAVAPVATAPVAQVAVNVTNSTVATPAVAETATTSVLPGQAGGEVTIMIPGVPNGQYEIQVIEEYDV